ncbi:MAG: Clp1/GlmU family protein [Nitrososphaerota archaeon]|nr:Clp1/GlmU family protein [Aigarchaeota archaeon]MDW8076880.1 Clp1/GlmU family protein [Nitrososphaerota archaeon]
MNVGAGKTLLVKGPASVKLISGSGKIFGYILTQKKPLFVRDSRALPIFTDVGMEVELSLGEGSSVEIVDHDTVPEDWKTLVSQVVKNHKKIVVMGGTDSGKTSLTTFIINSLLNEGKKASLVDLDLGQSNICPPTTIGSVLTTKQIPDIYQLKADFIAPVGFTSPSFVREYHLKKTGELLSYAAGEGDHTVIDCDGWIEGKDAEEHKINLLNVIKPSLVIFLEKSQEKVESYCKEIGIECAVVDKSEYVHKRDHEARKRLRESSFRRYLKDGSIKTVPLSWLKLSTIPAEAHNVAINPLQHVKSLVDAYNTQATVVPALNVDSLSKNKVGVLSYLFDADERCLGIGLVSDIDTKRNAIKIYSKLDTIPKKLVVGCMLLSYHGDELFVWTMPRT